MKAICIKTKLKSGSINQVKEWFGILNKRIDEVKETLRNENVLIESVFLDKHGEDYFLICYLKAKNISYVYEVFDKSKLPIDKYYKECWKKYCQEREILEELIDVDLLENVFHE